ncbi:hypothetical protein PAXRUDRAFT_11842 [Paxillus rubicundulus Ve08.2h10]|uniref:DNA polymerase beta palm domain-containing protein n=1 Tax=Paxillus rubicundulus Ve08.2h10 TaxID=930991 RepID=A0A0D0E2F9_9AGAM|nr:hypothetical protein PAXRUDRAFT_11842 [Paxillus rubicundulus Ve08.2h10]
MRPRLERHIDWEFAKTKAIVTPEWLRHFISSRTLLPCSAYSANSDLHDETERRRPEVKSNISEHPETPPDDSRGLQRSTDQGASMSAPDVVALKHLSRFCCQSASPLICPNQTPVKELDVIHWSRFLEGEERSMLSYARAIAIVKAFPHRFSERTQQADIAPDCPTAFVFQVEEFVKTGQIAEARFLATKSKKYQIVMQKLLSVEERCTSVIAGGYPPASHFLVDGPISYRRGKPQSNDVDIVIPHTGWSPGSQKVNSLCEKLVRRLHEHGLVKCMLRKVSTTELPPPYIPERSDMSEFHQNNVLRTHHWDSLAKALTVFGPPHNPTRERVYRRVDLTIAAPEVFWTAVVGCFRTGSTMFERDLCLWAKQKKGSKFDSSGMTQNFPTARLKGSSFPNPKEKYSNS